VRRETRQRDIAARRSDEAVPPPTAELERQEMLERLRTLLDELDEPARSVMQYRLYSEASYAEIACVLNIRANTAAVIYNRTVAKLRAAMKERYGYEI
jgi:RNA polymerase sigma-70 factor (ECF subfamily)